MIWALAQISVSRTQVGYSRLVARVAVDFDVGAGRQIIVKPQRRARIRIGTGRGADVSMAASVSIMARPKAGMSTGLPAGAVHQGEVGGLAICGVSACGVSACGAAASAVASPSGEGAGEAAGRSEAASEYKRDVIDGSPSDFHGRFRPFVREQPAQ